ncbi:hypothetical protein V7S43_006336 [Phytophthora oleae]|uniref:Uncharacterized protein n=1 Tax=Phytophthora oleae TaxID=2107226 RepID=A0ABD3FP66_9STRA
MQSPHGENQQWQHEEEESMQTQAPIRPEHSPQRTGKEELAARRPISLKIVSPSAFDPAFPVSPSTDDDYGLASPMALPDTPSQTRPGIALAWDLDPTSPKSEAALSRAESFRCLAQSKSVQRPERRASATSSFTAKAATPNPRNYRNFVPDRAASRITRSSLPTLPEVRGKARHGGIYSLLLKNKPVKQEPVLVEDAHNPEGKLRAR